MTSLSSPLRAVYRLPSAIWVCKDLLGAGYRVKVGGHQVEVHLPLGPPTHDDPEPQFKPGVVDLPRSFDEQRMAMDWLHRPAGIPDEPGEPVTAVAIVATEVGPDALTAVRRGERDDPDHRLASDLRRAVEPWFNLVADWISTCTGQDLDHMHPLYDAWIEGNGLIIWNDAGLIEGGRMVLTTSRVRPVQKWLWERALSAAATGLRPPLEHRLVRSTFAHYQRGLHRQAALDGASALELTLVRLGATKKTLGAKLHQLVSEATISHEVRAVLQREVVDVRNGVIHEAIEPTPAQGARIAELVGAMAHGRPLPPSLEDLLKAP